MRVLLPCLVLCTVLFFGVMLPLANSPEYLNNPPAEAGNVLDVPIAILNMADATERLRLITEHIKVVTRDQTVAQVYHPLPASQDRIARLYNAAEDAVEHSVGVGSCLASHLRLICQQVTQAAQDGSNYFVVLEDDAGLWPATYWPGPLSELMAIVTEDVPDWGYLNLSPLTRGRTPGSFRNSHGNWRDVGILTLTYTDDAYSLYGGEHLNIWRKFTDGVRNIMRFPTEPYVMRRRPIITGTGAYAIHVTPQTIALATALRPLLDDHASWTLRDYQTHIRRALEANSLAFDDTWGNLLTSPADYQLPKFFPHRAYYTSMSLVVRNNPPHDPESLHQTQTEHQRFMTRIYYDWEAYGKRTRTY